MFLKGIRLLDLDFKDFESEQSNCTLLDTSDKCCLDPDPCNFSGFKPNPDP